MKIDDYDVLIIHEDYFKTEKTIKENLLKKNHLIKVLASSSNKELQKFFFSKLKLPTSLKDLSQEIENTVVKKSFLKNSSIKIKDYILDKNEKKLIKDLKQISLTEKEIQLLQLLESSSLPLSKSKIQEVVWKYSSDADTHTVETHIYRLRKKIKTNFLDEDFIKNNKDGYSL